MLKRMLGLCDCKGCFAKARVEFPIKIYGTGKYEIQRLCNSCYE